MPLSTLKLQFIKSPFSTQATLTLLITRDIKIEMDLQLGERQILWGILRKNYLDYR